MKNKGYTHLELLVVIAILTVLFTAILIYANPNYVFKKSYDSQRIADINTIENAVKQFFLDNKNYSNLNLTNQKIEICNTRFIDTGFDNQISQNGNCDGFINLTKLVPMYIAGLPTDPVYIKNSPNKVVNLDNKDIKIGGSGYYIQLIGNKPIISSEYLDQKDYGDDGAGNNRDTGDMGFAIYAIIVIIIVIIVLSANLIWKSRK